MVRREVLRRDALEKLPAWFVQVPVIATPRPPIIWEYAATAPESVTRANSARPTFVKMAPVGVLTSHSTLSNETVDAATDTFYTKWPGPAQAFPIAMINEQFVGVGFVTANAIPIGRTPTVPWFRPDTRTNRPTELRSETPMTTTTMMTTIEASFRARDREGPGGFGPSGGASVPPVVRDGSPAAPRGVPHDGPNRPPAT